MARKTKFILHEMLHLHEYECIATHETGAKVMCCACGDIHAIVHGHECPINGAWKSGVPEGWTVRIDRDRFDAIIKKFYNMARVADSRGAVRL